MTQTIQLRQDGEPSENTTQYESPDTGTRQSVCAMYLANQIAEDLGSFVELEVSDEAEVEASLDKITGSDDDGNYGVYKTAGGSITGLYLSHETLAGVHGGEAEPSEAPESVGITLRESDSDAFDEAEGVDEDEMDALVDGDSDSDEDEEVEIADEEVGLVEN